MKTESHHYALCLHPCPPLCGQRVFLDVCIHQQKEDGQA